MKVRTMASLCMAAVLAVVLISHETQAAPAKAQNQQDIVKGLVADLQKNPNDAALREKIIKAVQGMKKAPKIPEEVDELVGKATYIFKSAKSKTDFEEAARAYQKALLIAPWVADYYYNLGAVQEKAENYTEAVDSLKLYLVAAPDAADAKAVRERIGAMKYAGEKASKEKLEREARENKIRQDKLNAQAILDKLNEIYRGRYVVKLKSCTPSYAWRDLGDGARQNACCDWSEYNARNWYTDTLVDPYPIRFTLSEDGNKVLFYAGGSTPTYIGTPVDAYDIQSVKWVTGYGNKPSWIVFKRGQVSYMTGTSPYPPGAYGFDEKEKYCYTEYLTQ